MSGQPCKLPSDVNKFRSEYMQSLAMRADIDEMNLEANKTYLSTGQLPAVSQMSETRTTSEILADTEKLKANILKDLSPLGNSHFALSIIQAIQNSFLNIDGSLYIFFAQRAPEIVENIKRQYKYGIEGNSDDVENFVSFVADMYKKTKSFTSSVKNYFRNPDYTSSTLGDLDGYNILLKDLSRRLLLLLKTQLNKTHSIDNELDPNDDKKLVNPKIAKEIRKFAYNIDKIMDSFSSEDFKRHTDFFIEHIKKYNGNKENDEMLDKMFDVYKQYDYSIKELPSSEDVNTLMEQLEKSFRNKSPDLALEILNGLDRDIEYFFEVHELDEELKELEKVYIDEFDYGENAQQSRENYNMYSEDTNINDYDDEDEDEDEESNEEESNEEESNSQSEEYKLGEEMLQGHLNDAKQKRIQEIESKIKSIEIEMTDAYNRNESDEIMQEYLDIYDELAKELNFLGNPNEEYHPFNTRGIKTRVKQKNKEPDELEKQELERKENSQTEIYKLREETLQKQLNDAKQKRIQEIESINERLIKIDTEIEKTRREIAHTGEKMEKNISDRKQQSNNDHGSDAMMYERNMNILEKEKQKLLDEHQKLRRKYNSLNEKKRELKDTYHHSESKQKPKGSGIQEKKPRGRPKGSGIYKQKPYKETVKASTNLNEGVDQSPRFVKFGRYLINTHKLNNEDMLAIKQPCGGCIVGLPSTRISKNMSHIVKKMIGNGVPTFAELSKLSEPEKAYLHKISTKANILDKFSIPAPDKDRQEKDLHDFEVMKGEIMAGNDNKELIKKFKLHLIKLIKMELLPKREAQEVMEELLSLGY